MFGSTSKEPNPEPLELFTASLPENLTTRFFSDGTTRQFPSTLAMPTLLSSSSNTFTSNFGRGFRMSSPEEQARFNEYFNEVIEHPPEPFEIGQFGFDGVQRMSEIPEHRYKPTAATKQVYDEIDQFDREPFPPHAWTPIMDGLWPGLLTNLKIKYGNSWELAIWVQNPRSAWNETIDIQLNYSLNKLLASYFKLPNKQICYFTSPGLMISRFYLSTSPGMEELLGNPIVKFDFTASNQPTRCLNPTEARYFPYFQKCRLDGTLQSAFTNPLIFLTDVLFIHCLPGVCLDGLILGFGGLKIDGTCDSAVQKNLDHEHNLILLQKTKQCDIYAIQWNRSRELWENPRDIKNYVRSVFKYFSETCLSETQNAPFTVDRFTACGPYIRPASAVSAGKIEIWALELQ
jgi:hypothetical protein